MLHEVFIADCVTPKFRSTPPFWTALFATWLCSEGFCQQPGSVTVWNTSLWFLRTLGLFLGGVWLHQKSSCVGKVDCKTTHKKPFLLNTELTVKMLHEVFTADCVSPKFRSTLLFWTTLVWRGTTCWPSSVENNQAFLSACFICK